MIDKVFPKVHNEGYKFLVIFGVITLIFYFISNFLGLVGLVLTIWCYYFFRDPERYPINNEDYLVSPADGVVLQVKETNGPKELNLENKKFTKVNSDNCQKWAYMQYSSIRHIRLRYIRQSVI